MATRRSTVVSWRRTRATGLLASVVAAGGLWQGGCRQDNDGLDGLKDPVAQETDRGGSSGSGEGGRGGGGSRGRGSANGGNDGVSASGGSGGGGNGSSAVGGGAGGAGAMGGQDPDGPRPPDEGVADGGLPAVDAEPAPPESAALAEDLVLYLRFDDGTLGMPRDLSAHRHVATLVDASPGEVTGAGKFGGGLELSGGPLGGFVRIENSATFAPAWTALTVSAWVMLPGDGEGASGTGTIVARRASGTQGQLFALRIVDGKANGLLNSGNGYRVNLTDSSALPTNVWVHLALTFDSAQAALYINGRQAGIVPYQLPLPPDVSPVIVGGNEVDRPLAVAERLAARLDEIAVHHRALTIAEIEDLAGGVRPSVR